MGPADSQADVRGQSGTVATSVDTTDGSPLLELCGVFLLHRKKGFSNEADGELFFFFLINAVNSDRAGQWNAHN